MKRLMIMAAVVLLVIGLVACTEGSTQTTDSKPTTGISALTSEPIKETTGPTTIPTRPSSLTTIPSHTHKWLDATCIEPKRCETCGITEGNAIGHRWADATCITAKKCLSCGVREGVAKGHTWDEGNVIVEATETTDGEILHTCISCGETKMLAIPSLSHEHNYDSEVVAPSCKEPGYTIHTCRCGDTYTSREVEARGHEWSVATCIAPQYCVACGTVGTAAMGHDYGAYEVVTDPTCTGNGLQQRNCSRCGAYETEPINPFGHSYVTSIKKPTCTEQGCVVHTCTACGDNYITDEKAALGHTWCPANCTTPKTCSVCSGTEGKAVGHKWSDATCKTPKTCSVCGATEGKSLGHSWKNATCTEPKACSICGVTEGTAVGHSWQAATCTIPKTCNTCGVSEGSASGHDWVEATCTTPKTCRSCKLSQGAAVHKYDGKVCSACGKLRPSEGLAFTKKGDVYYVSGIGTCADTDIVIPEQYEGLAVTQINSYAFKNCSSIHSVVIPNGITYIMSGAFKNCTNIVQVEIPDSVTKIGAEVFSGCSSLIEINIPDAITRIDERAFNGCKNLKNVKLPDSLVWIGARAFAECEELTSVVIPERVSYIGGAAFCDCKRLTSFTIPSSVKNIEGDTFLRCTALVEVNIPSSVVEIKNKAFYGCVKLEKLVIPVSVKCIGSYAFSTIALSAVVYDGTMAQWDLIVKENNWDYALTATEVQCTDGKISL